uniref:Uncharacterized protein n=1 Tax=Craspedostauros australis TaxID=1486917 RepID=A0A7R9ZQE5_9STRA
MPYIPVYPLSWHGVAWCGIVLPMLQRGSLAWRNHITTAGTNCFETRTKIHLMATPFVHWETEVARAKTASLSWAHRVNCTGTESRIVEGQFGRAPHDQGTTPIRWRTMDPSVPGRMVGPSERVCLEFVLPRC